MKLDYQTRSTGAAGPAYRRTPHWLAVLTTAATFPLIFMGGLVTSHGAGMSVPDWPNSYGYNMFTFPPSKWVGGIFYEHTHRLMGTVVGFLSILLAIAAWKWERRTWARRLAYAVLGAVIFQGVLGGLRVVLVQLDLAIVHACFAQAFFCLAALVAMVTSRWWLDPADGTRHAGGTSHDAVRRVVRLAVVCVAIVYLQLVVGAVMRHYRAGLAIPDLPLHYGQLLPPASAAALDRINEHRAWTLHLEPVTLTQVWVHFGHRAGAVLVTAAAMALIVAAVRCGARGMRAPAWLLGVLLLAQLTLGVLTVLMGKPADIASLHVAVGALVLLTSFVLAVRSMRLASLHRADACLQSENLGPTVSFPSAANMVTAS